MAEMPKNGKTAFQIICPSSLRLDICLEGAFVLEGDEEEVVTRTRIVFSREQIEEQIEGLGPGIGVLYPFTLPDTSTRESVVIRGITGAYIAHALRCFFEDCDRSISIVKRHRQLALQWQSKQWARDFPLSRTTECLCVAQEGKIFIAYSKLDLWRIAHQSLDALLGEWVASIDGLALPKDVIDGEGVKVIDGQVGTFLLDVLFCQYLYASIGQRSFEG
jgi:hypothetical protein